MTRRRELHAVADWIREKKTDVDYEPTKDPLGPTRTRPGTPERVAVYAARAARGEELYHPQDFVPPDIDISDIIPMPWVQLVWGNGKKRRHR